jgi:hypothetical protein
MHASLLVWLDGAADPVTVKPITVDFVEYARLMGKKDQPNGHELRLVIAYLHLESPDVASIKDIMQWARRREVIVDEADDAPGPIPPGP